MIRNRFALSISNDNNRYMTSAFHAILFLIMLACQICFKRPVSKTFERKVSGETQNNARAELAAYKQTRLWYLYT